MAKTIALIGSFDTKGNEYAFVKEQIKKNGHQTMLIDVGVLGKPLLQADITNDDVAQEVGASISELSERRDRGQAMTVMGEGAQSILFRLHEQNKIDGVMALGGTGGTSVACKAMRTLPIGFPKVMVSTVAGRDVSGYVDTTDIVMIPSIVDVSGINKISRTIMTRAAGAISGMVEQELAEVTEKPLIAASMFGNTTEAVEQAKSFLEKEGYEVIVFHCTGTGGRTMESLIAGRMIDGVLDITTTEWADELVGGVFAAGRKRLEAAAHTGVPAVVTPGCLDMVNFGEPDTVPNKFQGRTFYQHNPNVTLMRTNVQENQQLSKLIAEKINASTAPVTVLIPKKGVSVIAEEGGAFYWPEADNALFEGIRSNLRDDIPVIEMDCAINDAEFAIRCAQELLINIGRK